MPRGRCRDVAPEMGRRADLASARKPAVQTAYRSESSGLRAGTLFRGRSNGRAERRFQPALDALTTGEGVVIVSNMRALPLIRRRVVVAADAFVEVVVWRVQDPVPPSVHTFKYRLAYVVGGMCVLRYDNERGKGDHRHVDSGQSPYVFSTPEQLMVDFEADVARWNDEHGRA